MSAWVKHTADCKSVEHTVQQMNDEFPLEGDFADGSLVSGSIFTNVIVMSVYGRLRRAATNTLAANRIFTHLFSPWLKDFLGLTDQGSEHFQDDCIQVIRFTPICSLPSCISSQTFGTASRGRPGSYARLSLRGAEFSTRRSNPLNRAAQEGAAQSCELSKLPEGIATSPLRGSSQ